VSASNEAAARWSPARGRVYSYVRDGILHGRLPGGTFLEEEAISLAVGVSRTPVREAFQQLHSERLIDLLPRRGAMVRTVTVQELLEVYDARLMIETHALRAICAARLGPPAEMLTVLDQMQRLPAEQVVEHARLNSAFHRAIVTAGRNAVVAELYAALGSRQERVAVTSVGIDPGRNDLIQQEHVALVAAIGHHDADAASAVLQRHLRPVREILSHLPGGA
jgi:DNA-binding GntR family transcriptional regulator